MFPILLQDTPARRKVCRTWVSICNWSARFSAATLSRRSSRSHCLCASASLSSSTSCACPYQLDPMSEKDNIRVLR